MADRVFTGPIVLSDRVIENGYVLVGDGKVQAVGAGAAPAGERHGGSGFLVLPGASTPKRIAAASLRRRIRVVDASAAAGGVTTIVDMPYDDNCLIATAERLRTKVKEAPGIGARLPTWRFMCLNRPAIASPLVVIE
ncbi:hypothetical protein H8A99_09530 [Bradyrhizobium sp. Arg68]|nr:hypothetical protein [Bradyrhizobium ivorense]